MNDVRGLRIAGQSPVCAFVGDWTTGWYRVTGLVFRCDILAKSWVSPASKLGTALVVGTRAVTRRTDALAADRPGRSVRRVSFLGSRTIPQVYAAHTVLLLCAIITASRLAVFYYFGFSSSEYVYFYYFSDALLTVFLFLSICELSLCLARSKISRRRLALTGAGAFLVVSLFSALIASHSSTRMMSHFVVELSQNLYFASCLAIAALWFWKTFGDPEDRIAARFVSVVFVYTSIFILLYGARKLAPQVTFDHQLGQMMAVWVPLGCGFAAVSQEQPRITKL